jgi:DNA-binding MurR/RpiR family transcriptional regulator
MPKSLIDTLAKEARQLPPRLAHAARYVTLHPFDAATKPMRTLAKEAGHSPATFTRLAQVLGYPGWDELRVQIVEHARKSNTNASAPYSQRTIASGGRRSIAIDMLHADAAALAALDDERLALAAAMLEGAPRVLIAGFRSCHSPSYLFYYLYSLFRNDVVLLGGTGGVLDVELGGLRRKDAVVLFGFEPYSRSALMTAQAAKKAGCSLIVIADRESAPIAEGAQLTLTFPTACPGFFPSLTSCVSLIQALAALLYVRSGKKGRDALRVTEERIADHNAYVAQT